MKNKTLENFERPVFPKRAIVTGGMPYGNKSLHFGHVGGMFIHADIFARFLKDRIGKENVIFVSGTDCYGSPIMEGYRKKSEEGYTGTIEEYVTENHIKQKEDLEKYEVKPDLYGTSALGESGKIHSEMSTWVFNTLYENGWLKKLNILQFYDDELGILLNGRQVEGKCPNNGCQSTKGYADECELGHQYMPSELVEPISTLSGKKPSLKSVSNWYFALEDWMEMLSNHVDFLGSNTNIRKAQLDTIKEFLKKPCIYVQKKFIEDLNQILKQFPEHKLIDDPKKSSIELIFENLESRDKARNMLSNSRIRFRTGKTLVPFRLSGNIEWGVPIPPKEGMTNLTFWCWPESLWAPVSFTIAYLKQNGAPPEDAKLWWCNKDAIVYQFIGQDNIYFYSIAEMALFAALTCKKGQSPDMNDMNLPHVISNHHILFMDKKASSSSAIKPPMADELLNYYTPEQLRFHFFSLGLANKSTSFKPNVYLPKEEQLQADNVLTQGNLLTNVYNRIIRTCLFTLQTRFNSTLPKCKISPEVKKASDKAILDYEFCMYNHEFHQIINVLDEYIRYVNKYLVKGMKQAESEENDALAAQIIYDCMCCIRTAATLVHPLAPSGSENLQSFLGFSEKIWNWKQIFEPVDYFLNESHIFKKIDSHTDFFKKLDYQY